MLLSESAEASSLPSGARAMPSTCVAWLFSRMIGFWLWTSQTRTVVSYRLLCKDSIEERVALLQEKKRALVASVFAETEGTGVGQLSVEDIEALLA